MWLSKKTLKVDAPSQAIADVIAEEVQSLNEHLSAGSHKYAPHQKHRRLKHLVMEALTAKGIAHPSDLDGKIWSALQP